MRGGCRDALRGAHRGERRHRAPRRGRPPGVRPRHPAPRPPGGGAPPRTPLYGAFTQTFTTELGAPFADDPPGDAELARRLDEAPRRALPD
ncbi:hypothetical protein LV779_21055 [Streptomyces thinghirensis]|nr:hypothetical protein [Streptomyces thinghirensis]